MVKKYCSYISLLAITGSALLLIGLTLLFLKGNYFRCQGTVSLNATYLTAHTPVLISGTVRPIHYSTVTDTPPGSLGIPSNAVLPTEIARSCLNTAICINYIVRILRMSLSQAVGILLTFDDPFCKFCNEIEKTNFQQAVKDIIDNNARKLTLKLLESQERKKLEGLLADALMEVKVFMKSRGVIDDAPNDIGIFWENVTLNNTRLRVSSYSPISMSLSYELGGPQFLPKPSNVTQPARAPLWTLLEEGNNLTVCNETKPITNQKWEMKRQSTLNASIELIFDDSFIACPMYKNYIEANITAILKIREADTINILSAKALNEQSIEDILRRNFLDIKTMCKSIGLFEAAIDDLKFRYQLDTYPYSVQTHSKDPFEWHLTLRWDNVTTSGFPNNSNSTLIPPTIPKPTRTLPPEKTTSNPTNSDRNTSINSTASNKESSYHNSSGDSTLSSPTVSSSISSTITTSPNIANGSSTIQTLVDKHEVTAPRNCLNMSLCINYIVRIFRMSLSIAGGVILKFDKPFCNFCDETEKTNFEQAVKDIMENTSDPALKLLNSIGDFADHPIESEKFEELLVETLKEIITLMESRGLIDVFQDEVKSHYKHKSEMDIREYRVFFDHPISLVLTYEFGRPMFLLKPSNVTQPPGAPLWTLLEEGNNLTVCNGNAVIRKQEREMVKQHLNAIIELTFSKSFYVCSFYRNPIEGNITAILEKYKIDLMEQLSAETPMKSFLERISRRIFLEIKGMMKSIGLFEATTVNDVTYRYQLDTYPHSIQAFSSDPIESYLTLRWADTRKYDQPFKKWKLESLPTI